MAQAARRGQVNGLERLFYAQLIAAGVPFEPQISINDNYIVDALTADGRVLEVFGCYWHDHPTYRETGVYKPKDRAKLAYLAACDYPVEITWECEVPERPRLALCETRRLVSQ